ncbi:hypothetical protein KBD34_04665 [Patescibacteria group bacterium]|nr:hypothetical protein [Patescibacteria group bacterium]
MQFIFFISLALSGLSIAWHVFLEDHPSLKMTFKQRSKWFVCGVCQIFWGSLLFSIMVSPFRLEWRGVFTWLGPYLNWFSTWQAMAMTAYLMRYLFLLILESVKEKLRKTV